MEPYAFLWEYNKTCNELLLDYIDNGNGGNLIMSPLSIMFLLEIVADSVSGNTRDEIMEFITRRRGMDFSLDTLRKVMNFTGELKSADAVIISEKISQRVKEEYKAAIKEKYDAEVFSSKNMVKDVNDWVREKTDGMIDGIADESMNHGSVTEVEMMDSTEYSYIENDYFTGFTKDYKDRNYAFMALLPKKQGDDYLKKAISESNLSGLFIEAKSIETFVSMPEFRSEFSENLNALLERNGIKQIFTDSADFSPVTKEVQLKTDSIIHKAYIEVDRRGTKAAAVTMDDFVGCAPPEDDYMSVELNRPFIYAIMNKITNFPVFIGTVNNL